jgi:putative tryptophan/tyrosine transport system substrate-binding protein
MIARDRISRRAFTALALGTAAWPRVVLAQQSKKAVIGFVSWWPPEMASHLEALREGLRDLGHVEGQNVEFDAHFTGGNRDRTQEVVDRLVRRNVDVLVASTTPAAHIAKNATRTIPIVMAPVADPLATGLVASLSHPGGNVTGLTSTGPDLGEKRLEMLREMRRSFRTLAFLGSSVDPNARTYLRELQAASDRQGVRLVTELVDGPGRIETRTFESFKRQGAEAVFIQPIFFGHHERIVPLARQAELAVVGQYPQFAESGGLLAFGFDDLALMRRAAYFVDRILKGSSPATLPVEQPTKYLLVINARTARRLGWSIPESLLIRADRIIE